MPCQCGVNEQAWPGIASQDLDTTCSENGLRYDNVRQKVWAYKSLGADCSTYTFAYGTESDTGFALAAAGDYPIGNAQPVSWTNNTQRTYWAQLHYSVGIVISGSFGDQILAGPVVNWGLGAQATPGAIPGSWESLEFAFSSPTTGSVTDTGNDTTSALAEAFFWVYARQKIGTVISRSIQPIQVAPGQTAAAAIQNRLYCIANSGQTLHRGWFVKNKMAMITAWPTTPSYN